MGGRGRILDITLRDALWLKARHHGGQTALARHLDTSQPNINRLLNGGALSRTLARRIARRFPDLRPLVEADLLSSLEPLPERELTAVGS